MKAILTLATTTLMSFSAFAGHVKIACAQLDRASDSGYAISLDQAMTKANIQTVGAAGVRTLKRLRCEVPAGARAETMLGTVLVQCTEDQKSEAGFSFRIEKNRETLKAIGNLEKDSTPVAQFMCQLIGD